MSTISVKIIHKESGKGLRELLAIIFDVDKLNEGTTTTSAAAESNIEITKVFKKGIRLGSAISDADGKAILEFDAKDLAASEANGQGPDLVLLVLLPDEPGLSLKDRLLYSSKNNRIKPGSKESYVIKLNTALLKSKKITVPEASAPADDEITKLGKDIKARKDHLARKKALLKDTIVADDEKHKKTREEEFISPFLDKISKVPKSMRDGKYFVKPGQSISRLNIDNIRTAIDEFIGPSRPEKQRKVKGFIYLSENEKNKYEAYLDPTGKFYNLPDDIAESDILPKLFHTSEAGSANNFFMDHPAARKLRESEKNDTGGTTGGSDGTTGTNGSLPPATAADIPLYVAHQMHTATSPEEQLAAGLPLVSLEKRASREDISNNIANTVFQKGPADVPAYYEFHSLKIAFENVWQEVMDMGLIEHAEKWYDHALANGEDPKKSLDKPRHKLAHGHKGNNDDDDDKEESQIEEMEPGIILEFPGVISIWRKLYPMERAVLNNLSKILLSKYKHESTSGNSVFAKFLHDGLGDVPYLEFEHLVTSGSFEVVSTMKQKGLSIVEAAKERIEDKAERKDEMSSVKRANHLKNELNGLLKGNYSFKHYAADESERSVNFGILLTYQQKWEPLNYQVGELVTTIPLAPKETRKFSKKTVIKKHRTQKEQEENLRITKSDSSDTSRADAEIVSKANNKSSMGTDTTASGGMNVGAYNVNMSSNLTTHNDAEKDSQQTKKDFHEAVVKASQEFKNERKVEVTSEETYESEITESGEISNPNDELTVTYLFYELQRQFRISERLYRLRPVVMVAQEMPAPHEIDNDWVLTHDWILKRVLLDDSFRYGMDCIYTINGEKLLLDQLERTVKDQRQIIKSLSQNVRFITEEVSRQNRLMMGAIDKEANITEDKGMFDSIPIVGKSMSSAAGALDGIGNFLGMGGDDTADAKEAARIRREAMTAAYERSERERRELLGRLESETGVLNGLTKQLAVKQKEYIEKQTHIARLKVHIKDNILFYMQSLWNYEHKDQRFFRLMDTEVPQFKGKHKIVIRKNAVENKNLNDLAVPDKTRHRYTLEPDMHIKEVTLKEVADLDTLLGYKGNYMIFPMNKSNILTDFMMAPYLDNEFGLTDPDNIGNWSLDDFEKFKNAIQKEMGESFVGSEMEKELKKFHKQLLQDPLRNGDLLTVPTGSLFIEALPGSHTILEYFKLAHRFIDVKKVQAEVRGQELENIRYAARILNKENEDPSIEKKIVVEGNGINFPISDQ